MTDTVQVPREATEEMLQAMDVANATYIAAPKGYWPAVYRAMIAAAPQATDPRDAETTGLSWNGFNVTGDRKSIDEVLRMETVSSQVEVYRAAFQERIATLTAERDAALAAVKRLLLEFDFLVESGALPDVRDDIIFVNARALTTQPSKETPPHPAPDATDPVNDLLGGGPYYGMKDTAPDATDWKARCEAAEKALNPPFAHREDCAGACLDVTCLGCFNAGLRAAQAENEKLRAELAQCRKAAEVTERLHDGLRDAIDDAFEAWPIGIANASHKILRNAAAFSPPPLSPEKP